MGYLWTQPWEMTARTHDRRAELVGEVTFPYADPVTGRLCELRFEKRMTAYEGSTRLKMDYRIENVGERRARFQHCVHGSPCVARISERVALPEGAGELVLLLQNAAGEQVLARGGGE